MENQPRKVEGEGGTRAERALEVRPTWAISSPKPRVRVHALKPVRKRSPTTGNFFSSLFFGSSSSPLWGNHLASLSLSWNSNPQLCSIAPLDISNLFHVHIHTLPSLLLPTFVTLPLSPPKTPGQCPRGREGGWEMEGDRDPGALSPENRIQEWRQNRSCELYNHCSF